MLSHRCTALGGGGQAQGGQDGNTGKGEGWHTGHEEMGARKGFLRQGLAGAQGNGCSGVACDVAEVPCHSHWAGEERSVVTTVAANPWQVVSQ